MANKVGASSHHIGFLDHFSKLDDPRQINKSLYPLEEILLLVLCAVLSGADDWVAIALYGEKKLDFLRRFLPYENGTPSHDQLGYLFGRIDEKRFQLSIGVQYCPPIGVEFCPPPCGTPPPIRHVFQRLNNCTESVCACSFTSRGGRPAAPIHSKRGGARQGGHRHGFRSLPPRAQLCRLASAH